MSRPCTAIVHNSRAWRWTKKLSSGVCSGFAFYGRPQVLGPEDEARSRRLRALPKGYDVLSAGQPASIGLAGSAVICRLAQW